MKINKKQIIAPLFVLSAFGLSAALINTNPANFVLAESTEFTIDHYEVESEGGGIGCTFGGFLGEQEMELYFFVDSETIDGTWSIANGKVDDSDIMFSGPNYTPYYSVTDLEVTFADIGDTMHSVECTFVASGVTYAFETEVKFYSETSGNDDYTELTIDNATVYDDWGTYIVLETSFNGEYRELELNLNGEGDSIDGEYYYADYSLYGQYCGENYQPNYYPIDCSAIITDLGNDKHSVKGTYVCEEGSFSFNTTIDYPSSTVAPVDGEKIIINNSYVESGFINYLNFETVINNEFRCIVLELNTADTIDGKFSLADGSIISSDTGMFNYTYDENYNIKSCEITVVDNGDDTHSCSCVIEIDEGVFYFNTAIAYESSIQRGNPITITDYAIEDNGTNLLLYGLLEDKEVEVKFKINSNKLEGIYSFADETLDSKECKVYSRAIEMYLPVEDMTLAIIECGDDEYKVNASIMISGYPFYISTTIDNGSGLVNPGIDITAVSYSLESGLMGQSIILIDENGCEYDFMIMAFTIQSGVIYNLVPDMYGYYTAYYPNSVTCYQATDASFKHTQNDDGSHRVDAFMKLESGDEFYISYSNDHSNKEAHDSVPATCTTDGTKAYYECVCGKYFEDEECTIEIGDTAALATWLATENEGLISKTGHRMKFDSFVWDGYTAKAKFVCENKGCKETQLVDATVTNAVTTEPTCENKGVKTYTATYDSHTDTNTEEIAANGHTVTEIDGVAATCETAGYSKAYKCSDCGKYFKDANATQVIGDETAYNTWKVGEDKVAAKGHNLTKFEGEKATVEKDGYKDAWKCANCNKFYSDENGTNLIGDAAAFESWKLGDGKIARLEPTPKEEPKGCNSSIIASSAIVSIVTTIGAILVASKRKEDK